MKHIAIFASGTGSNALNITKYFKSSNEIRVNLIVTNNPKAAVIQKAKLLKVDIYINNLKQQDDEVNLLNTLKKYNISFIVLAGFLKLVPQSIISEFDNKIINIHPALLPKYGGKGMYGMKVHETVINSNEQISGITIHYVNSKYDQGQIIFQQSCKLDKNETPDSLATKIHALEYEHYPKIIEQLIRETY